MLVNCTIVKYGTEEKFIEISIIKTWDVSEEEILNRYEPLFDHYLRWIIRNNEDSFIKFVHFTKEHNDTIKLHPTSFTVEHKNGTLGDATIKMIAGIDAILSFNDVELFAKGNQLWISKKYETNEKYYYEI
jgi:hypothetical protein